jgi:CHAT domain-containing protein
MKLRLAEVWRFLLLFTAPVFLLCDAHPVQAETPGNTRTTLVFYSDSDKSAPPWTALFDTFAQELALQKDYPLPPTPDLILASSIRRGQQFGPVVGIRLRGRCDVVQQAYRPMHPGPLGWVLRVSGEIQPFIFVDCERLAQLLNQSTLRLNKEQRTNAMMQAISRIVIHEWIHIATQSDAHAAHGIRQSELSADELAPLARTTGGR